MIRRTLAAIAIAVILTGLSSPSVAHEGETHVTATYSPVDTTPVGESNPLVAALAAGGIILVGGAGIYIYRLIKKGL